MEVNKKKKKKKQPWMKKRHAFITAVARMVLKPYIKRVYNIKVDKFKEQGDRQYLILANHQTGFDQFFPAYAFKGPIYYVASEDIFSMGFISKLLRFAVNPIPIKKQTTDISAVLNCLRVAKEGATIAIFPEGNRTYDGKTVHINPAIVMLAKKLSLPIAFFRIEGGYGVSPRWADSARKGKMHGYVSKVLEPEEYKSLSDEEMAELINKELYVDEARADAEFHSDRLAEYLERAIYYCPKCNALSTFESHGDEIECKKCGLKAKYLPTKEIVGLNYDLPYHFVADWYQAQLDFVNSLDLSTFENNPICCEKGEFYEVIVYKNKYQISKNIEILLFADKIKVKDENFSMEFPFDEIKTITVCGKNKLNIYFGDKLYQITGGERFNALKYMNFTFRYRNIKKAEKGEGYEQFLGL